MVIAQKYKTDCEVAALATAAGVTWEQARAATRNAWHRVEQALPGDADGDGR